MQVEVRVFRWALHTHMRIPVVVRSRLGAVSCIRISYPLLFIGSRVLGDRVPVYEFGCIGVGHEIHPLAYLRCGVEVVVSVALRHRQAFPSFQVEVLPGRTLWLINTGLFCQGEVLGFWA